MHHPPVVHWVVAGLCRRNARTAVLLAPFEVLARLGAYEIRRPTTMLLNHFVTIRLGLHVLRLCFSLDRT